MNYTKYLVQPGVAVFEPEDYNPDVHSPSPIFLQELKAVSDLPDDWKLFPRFKRSLFGYSVYLDFEGADLYGTGEVRGKLRRNNDHQFFWNTENPTGFLFKGKKLYQSHPWVMGVRRDGTAFGIIADTTYKSELSTFKWIRFYSQGPRFRVVIIEKENPAEVLKTLADLTGKMEMPPMWALGYQQCRYSYYPQERASQIAFSTRNHRIPCDVIWLDIHYMDNFKIFTFNPEGFASPKYLNDFLHKNNIKAVYMIDPGVKAEEGYFVDDQGRAGDYFVRNITGEYFRGRVWPGLCHFPDFTNPETCKWWAGLYKDFMATGIDGVWNDMNEPSVFSGFGSTIPELAIHKGGGQWPAGTHKRYHNIYGYLMVKASREGIMAANPDKRPFVLSRSNFLGGQRYAAMWTGDNYSDYSQMKEAVPMCLNISLSGQPFNGPDIGGFLRDCTPDLLKHWTCSGIYFPFARNHTMMGTVDQEPWAFDIATGRICRTAIERRYRLMPYYYTLFEEASRTGLPVMQPVFMADVKDLTLRSEQQAYMIGRDLLVVPRWCEKPALPKGGWRLFSFEEEDDGFQAYLALRPGAALPVSKVIQSTVDYDPSELTLLVNPGPDGKAHGSLYVDAGEGYGYKSGEFALVDLDVEVRDGEPALSVSRRDGKLDYQGKFKIVLVDGKDVNEAKLQYVKVKDGSLAKGYSKLELIFSQLLPKHK